MNISVMSKNIMYQFRSSVWSIIARPCCISLEYVLLYVSFHIRFLHKTRLLYCDCRKFHILCDTILNLGAADKSSFPLNIKRGVIRNVIHGHKYVGTGTQGRYPEALQGTQATGGYTCHQSVAGPYRRQILHSL